MACHTPTRTARSLFPDDELSLSSASAAAPPLPGTGAGDTRAAESRTEPAPAPAPMADEEGSGIMGATICFTPGTTPTSSIAGTAAHSRARDGRGSAFLGSAEGGDDRDDSYEILVDVASKLRVSSNEDEVGRVGASQDREAAVSAETKASKGQDVRERRGHDRASTLSSLSPCSTLPSLGDAPFRMFKTPQPDGEKAPPELSAENESAKSALLPSEVAATAGPKDGGSLEASPNSEAPREAPAEDERASAAPLPSKDIAKEGPKESEAPDASPNNDPSPLMPFRNLHKFWNEQPSFAHMTKSAIERMLREDTPRGVEAKAQANAEADAPANAAAEEATAALNACETEASEDGGTSPPGTRGAAPGSAAEQSNKAEEVVDVIPKHNTSTLPLMKTTDTAWGFVAYLVSFLGACARVPSFLCVLQGMCRHLLQKVMNGVTARGTLEASETATAKADAVALSEDARGHGGTNLSKLFFDETDVQGRSALAAAAVGRTETGGPETGRGVPTVDPQEKATRKKMLDKAAASIAAGREKTLSGLRAVHLRYAICTLLSVTLAWHCQCQRGGAVPQAGGMDVHRDSVELQSVAGEDLCCFATRSASFASLSSWEWEVQSSPETRQESAELHMSEGDDLRCFSTPSASFVSVPFREWEFQWSPTVREDVQEHPLGLQSVEERDSCFFSTQSTSFASVSLWEFELSSSTSSGFIEEELLEDQDSVNEASSHWVYAFLAVSVVASFFCVVLFQSKRKVAATKPKSPPRLLTGHWTQEEHEQFLVGYKECGNHWKSVSDFVPTRTPAQVRCHGVHWLKIGSPLKMKKVRKATPAPSATPEPRTRTDPETPKSVSSVQSTPRKSNRATVTPLKGILIEKDHNQLYKHVTPRSEERTRRTQAQDGGTKSEPRKRRVRIQEP